MNNWLARLWIFIDERDIDKHVVSGVIMYGTIKVTEWSMRFAEAHPAPENLAGTAGIIAAVTAPYMALQAAAIAFYFNSRSPKG